MAGFVNITMLGGPELQRKLQKIGKKMQSKVVNKAFRPAAKKVRDSASKNAPRSAIRGRPGKHLANAIRITQLGSRLKKRGFLGLSVATPKRKTIGVDASDKYYYPIGQELGIPARGIAGKKYLRNALKRHEGSALISVKNELWKLILKATRTA